MDAGSDRMNPFEVRVGDTDDSDTPDANPACGNKKFNFVTSQSTLDVDCNKKGSLNNKQ